MTWKIRAVGHKISGLPNRPIFTPSLHLTTSNTPPNFQKKQTSIPLKITPNNPKLPHDMENTGRRTQNLESPKSSHFHTLITFNHFNYLTQFSDKTDICTP